MGFGSIFKIKSWKIQFSLDPEILRLCIRNLNYPPILYLPMLSFEGLKLCRKWFILTNLVQRVSTVKRFRESRIWDSLNPLELYRYSGEEVVRLNWNVNKTDYLPIYMSGNVQILILGELKPFQILHSLVLSTVRMLSNLLERP